ncbi:hypothetical protein FIBSPDRAFT_905096 [Athelia psychrophila]|uniref:Uncharacterized protein n=1 Tax=Athelia psychrophila TaxID=1759441 RepID=A0A167TVR5_9AGAM|nr:hypothetical protein FIBSPDRAFT_905096 [Fibularhizoctonia sp. CBS 109695]
MSRVCQVLVLFHKNGTGLKDQSLPILYSKSLLVTNLILFNIFIAKALSEGELANLAFQAANSATSIIQHDDIEMGDYNDVVNGRQPVVISHTGSEMGAMAAAVVPRRKHRDHNQLRQRGFNYQIEALTDAYTSYIYNHDHGINREAIEGDNSS